jgi:hypothetical protein
MNLWSAMADAGGNPNGAYREILPGVRVYPQPADVARGAARLFVDYAWQSIAKYGEFMVALSGGNTPRMLFEVLASDEFRGQVDWARRICSGATSALFLPKVRTAITVWPGANCSCASPFRRQTFTAWKRKSPISDARRMNMRRCCENIWNWTIAASRDSI